MQFVSLLVLFISIIIAGMSGPRLDSAQEDSKGEAQADAGAKEDPGMKPTFQQSEEPAQAPPSTGSGAEGAKSASTFGGLGAGEKPKNPYGSAGNKSYMIKPDPEDMAPETAANRGMNTQASGLMPAAPPL